MTVMVSGDSVLTPDFKTTPYWWEEASPPAAPDSLPAQADVVVVGSGYTGLSASLTLLQAGRQVLVLDAENLGAGASSRNAGSMGRTFRHNFSELAATRGIDFATRVYREVHGAFEFAHNRIESEGIEYPTLVFEGADRSGLITAHETAHQWFYSLVGNDQARQQWNDRALAIAARLERDGLAAVSRSPETRAAGHGSAQALAHAARGMLTQHDPRVIEALPGITVPVLVIVGAQDEPFLGAASYLAAKIPGAVHAVLPGAGHASNLDQPALFNEQVLRFLDQPGLS